MKEKILITSALPYENGKLHFGNIAGAYFPVDVNVRFKRLNKAGVIFLVECFIFTMVIIFYLRGLQSHWFFHLVDG